MAPHGSFLNRRRRREGAMKHVKGSVQKISTSVTLEETNMFQPYSKKAAVMQILWVRGFETGGLGALALPLLQ